MGWWRRCGSRKVFADHITGAKPEAAYHGSKLATKLKVMGVELASMGITEPAEDRDEIIQFTEPKKGTYKKLIVREGRLVGAILMGDISKAAYLMQCFDRDAPLPDGFERVALRAQSYAVFRLTLVKGFNVEDEVEGYADLVAKGLPCFVEIKGVTYCAGPGLTMQNVPFYEEVVAFVEALDTALVQRGLEYGIAAEHAHSCCALLASKRFFINDKWNTVIDYDRFFTLLEGGEEFGPEDYCKETPEWALWGNGGFDPRDERVDRKGRPKEQKREEKIGLPTEEAKGSSNF